MGLIRRHVAASLIAAPTIFTARRTVVLPPEGPELRGNSSGASAWLVSSLFTASNVAAPAFVRIWRLSNPGEFGTDPFD